MAKRHCEIEIVGERNILESVIWCIRGSLILMIGMSCLILGAIYYLLIWMPVIFIYQPIQQFFSETLLSLWYQFVYVSYSVFITHTLVYVCLFGYYSFMYHLQLNSMATDDVS